MRTITTIALFGAHVALGCSSGEGASPPRDTGELAPPPAGAGIQYRVTSTIAPGQEVERCKLVVAPPEGLTIQRDEVRFSPGSHHVLLYKTPYKEIPKETRRGVPIDAAEVHDCSDGAGDSWNVTGILAGSQSFEGDTILGSLPEGVAIKVEPGAVLVMNTHYLNASSEPLLADARINLHTIPPEDAKEEASILFFYNGVIHVPANSSASARMRCPISRDISIVSLQSHMHRRGVGFSASLVRAEGGAMEEIYAHNEWEQVPAKVFDPLLSIKAGEALDFRCDYANTESRDVIQGLTTKDEMCVLLAPYYPADPLLDACLDSNGIPAETWIGSGTASCAESLSCVANTTPAYEDGGSALYSCILNSCPGVATEISDVIRCQFTEGRGACESDCAKDAETCAACVASACAADVSACQAASCN
jgi:hypothetical protein